MLKKSISRLSDMFRNWRIVYKDKERKALHRILKEFLIASFKSKSIATYYFTSFLYKKHITNYMDYISHKEWQFMQRAICDSMTYVILGDKLYFHEYFDKFKIPMPRLLAYNIREKFFVSDDNGWISYEITSSESLSNLLKTLLGKSFNYVIFVKPTVSSGGIGIFRFTGQEIISPNPQMNVFFKNSLSGTYIYQEEVNQHKDLSILNPNSLNTVRIDTFKALGKKPEVLSAYLRIGRARGYVDNLASGGLRVGINMETGTLKMYGTNEIHHGALFITHHPETGIEFNGFQIPFFNKMKLMSIEAANCLPQSLIGWDIAISNNGPVLIEGNTVYYAMSGADIAYGGYRNNPVYRKVTEYVKNELNSSRR